MSIFFVTPKCLSNTLSVHTYSDIIPANVFCRSGSTKATECSAISIRILCLRPCSTCPPKQTLVTPVAGCTACMEILLIVAIRYQARVSIVAACSARCSCIRESRCTANLPACLARHLQSVLNAASARLIFNLRLFDHVSDALISLHCLRVPERIASKVAVLM